jgi:hypothetical protein
MLDIGEISSLLLPCQQQSDYDNNMKKDDLYIRTSVSWPPAIDRWFKKQAKKFGITVSAYVVQLGIEDMKREQIGREAAEGQCQDGNVASELKS